jgi:hypothetical protein
MLGAAAVNDLMVRNCVADAPEPPAIGRRGWPGAIVVPTRWTVERDRFANILVSRA